MGLGSLPSEIMNRYRALGALQRIVLWLLLLLQVPLLYLAANRLPLNFEIDRAPYAILHVVERVRIGEPMYVPLAPGQASLTYPPFYLWLCGMLWKVFGPIMAIPRIVSFLSAMVFATLMGAFVWRNTERDLLLSVAAPCVVLSTYAYMEPWMIAMIVDPLQVALAVGGFFLLAKPLSMRKTVAAAILMGLSMLTKQTSLAFICAGTLYLLVENRRMAAWFAGISLGLVAVVFYWQNASTDGEFWQQAFESAGVAPWYAQRIWNEVLFPDLMGRFGIFFVMVLVSLFLTSEGFWRTIWRPEYFMFGAGVAVAVIAQPKLGSGATQALVGYAGIAVSGAIGLHRLFKVLPAPAGGGVVAVLVAFQAVTVALPMISSYSMNLVDDNDRAKYQQIADVFARGRSCLLYFAYLPKVFGQPDSGPFGEERSIWKNKRIDYSNKPDSVNEPLYKQVYDNVIVGAYAPREDPTLQAVLSNYKPVARIPGHPRGVQGGNLRYEYIVFRANRLMPPDTGGGQPGPGGPVR